MKGILVYKGGPGSGFVGHAGRPGKVGGSQPLPGFVAEQIPSTQPGIGLRPTWYSDRIDIMHELMLLYRMTQGHGVGSSFHPDTIKEVVEARKHAVEIIESLNQDELQDIIYYMDSNWNTVYEQVKERYPPGGKYYTTDYWGIDRRLLYCRLDEEHSIALRDIYLKDAENYDTRYYEVDKSLYKAIPEGKYGDMHNPEYARYSTALDETRKLNDEIRDKNSKQSSALEGLGMLAENGPTQEFRQGVIDSMVSDLQVSHTWERDTRQIGNIESLSGNPDINVVNMRPQQIMDVPTGDVGKDAERLVRGWLYDSSNDYNPIVHAATVRMLDGDDAVECYWTLAHTGVIYRDVDERWVDAVRFIYNRTQAYYTANPRKIPALYRGMTQSPTVQSPVESWTSQMSSAKKFGNIMLTKEAGTPQSRILMSYKALEGVWLPESDLTGKKEHVIISDWLWEMT